MVSKQQQQGFHSYLRVASQAKNEEVQMQATNILEKYSSMDKEGKKAMVSNFYKCGAKRNGLKSLYRQSLTHKSVADQGSWEGYLTAEMVMSKFGVPGGAS